MAKIFNYRNYPYAECREQHVWKFYEGALDKPAKQAYQVKKCANCDMKRYRVLSMRPSDYGKVLSTRYHQPDGYRVPGGLDWHDLGKLRMRNYLHDLEEKEQQ